MVREQRQTARCDARAAFVPSCYLLARAKSASSLLPRSTAASSACFAVFWPAHTASSSSSITSRIWTKLPMRRPLELSVGGLQIELLHRHVAPGELFVEALRARMLIGRLGDRHVAGLHVPLRLHIRAGQVAEELGDTLVLVLGLSAQHPERRPADDGILRRALDVRVVRQHGDPELHVLHGLREAARRTGRCHDHRALAGGEFRVRLTLAAGIDENLLLLPFGEVLDVADAQRIVDRELDVRPGEPVRPGRKWNVVPRAEILDLYPGLPLAGEPALVAGGQELLRVLLHVRPGFRRRWGRGRLS